MIREIRIISLQNESLLSENFISDANSQRRRNVFPNGDNGIPRHPMGGKSAGKDRLSQDD